MILSFFLFLHIPCTCLRALALLPATHYTANPWLPAFILPSYPSFHIPLIYLNALMSAIQYPQSLLRTSLPQLKLIPILDPIIAIQIQQKAEQFDCPKEPSQEVADSLRTVPHQCWLQLHGKCHKIRNVSWTKKEAIYSNFDDCYLYIYHRIHAMVS